MIRTPFKPWRWPWAPRSPPVPAAEEEILEYIDAVYRPGSAMSRLVGDLEPEDMDLASEETSEIGHLRDMAREAPIIQLVNLLVLRAIQMGASDIHLEPFEDSFRVRYRRDGLLYEAESPPKGLQAAVLSRLKIMSRLDIAERRLPQDGRFRLKVQGHDIDFRVSTLPTLLGESMVIRILDREKVILDLNRLGFPPRELKQFDELIHKPYGMLLVTGPTGSGKTTTLYGALEIINSPDKKIITIEDPVEYRLAGVTQMQVKSGIGLTFARALRHIVRQDPDVVLVGEIRDRETAEIAVHAALTGHLVFSTLHTNDAAGAISRLAGDGRRGLSAGFGDHGHPGPAAGARHLPRMPRAPAAGRSPAGDWQKMRRTACRPRNRCNCSWARAAPPAPTPATRAAPASTNFCWWMRPFAS